MLNENIVLSARNISKKYSKSKKAEFENESPNDLFWALKDINFELKKGEILGIIGLNGAGKSTLLKVLSEVIPPTTGEIEYKGSILSILDIGTGFHPDLTGYENIFLNASILGMPKKEVEKKANEIIAFSGLADSIHELVKNYSNGMYLRLALSIALFTDNEIILIDEIISVGDLEFRKKGTHKIKEETKRGKSCIVISHDLETILEFSTRCLLIENGKIVEDGDSKTVVENYYRKYFNKQKPAAIYLDPQKKCELISINPTKNIYTTNESVEIEINYEVKQKGDYRIFLTFRSYQSKVMTASNAFLQLNPFNNIQVGKYKIVCKIPKNIFNRGAFIIDLIIGTETEPLIQFEQACQFDVTIPEWETDKSWNSFNEIIPFRPDCKWELISESV